MLCISQAPLEVTAVRCHFPESVHWLVATLLIMKAFEIYGIVFLASKNVFKMLSRFTVSSFLFSFYPEYAIIILLPKSNPSVLGLNALPLSHDYLVVTTS